MPILRFFRPVHPTGHSAVISKPFWIKEHPTKSFKCFYDTTVSVDSTSFNVLDVKIEAAASSSGSLAGGMEMGLGVSGAQVILGDILEITIKWLVKISNLSFHIDSCTVIQD